MQDDISFGELLNNSEFLDGLTKNWASGWPVCVICGIHYGWNTFKIGDFAFITCGLGPGSIDCKRTLEYNLPYDAPGNTYWTKMQYLFVHRNYEKYCRFCKSPHVGIMYIPIAINLEHGMKLKRIKYLSVCKWCAMNINDEMIDGVIELNSIEKWNQYMPEKKQDIPGPSTMKLVELYASGWLAFLPAINDLNADVCRNIMMLVVEMSKY